MDTQPSNEDDRPTAEQQDWSYTSLQHVLSRLIAGAVVIIVVGVFVGLVTYFVRAAEEPTYEAVARFAISPNAAILSAQPADQIESVAALDRPIVNATVSELLQSGAVAESAAADVGLPIRDLDDYDFDASEVPGAAIVRLSITGPDADTVSALAAAVRDSDESLASEFMGVFDVRSIDRADTSSSRIAPSPTRDALAVSLAAMIAAGAAVILLGERVRVPSRRGRSVEGTETAHDGEAESASPDGHRSDPADEGRDDAASDSPPSDDDASDPADEGRDDAASDSPPSDDDASDPADEGRDDAASDSPPSDDDASDPADEGRDDAASDSPPSDDDASDPADDGRDDAASDSPPSDDDASEPTPTESPASGTRNSSSSRGRRASGRRQGVTRTSG